MYIMKSIAAAILAALALTVTSIGAASPANAAPIPATSQDASFYQIPPTLPAQNGKIIKSESADFYLDPLRLIKVDADTKRVMFKSTDTKGAADAVVGTVLTPKRKWLGLGSRPLVVVDPGTQGLGDQCAPSRQLSMGTEYEGPFIGRLLAKNYAVAIVDYEGLGTAPAHTYLNRLSQGQATLDMARAVLNLGVSGVNARSPIGVAGYSQGGGAAAAAAELAKSYAPELPIKGVYAGSIEADSVATAENVRTTLYQGFIPYLLSGVQAAYGVDLSLYLSPRGLRVVAEAGSQCVVETMARNVIEDTRTWTKTGEQITAVMGRGELKKLFDLQKAGTLGKPSMPVLVGTSFADDIVPTASTKAVAQNWCGSGATVQYKLSLIPTHILAYPDIAATAMGFFAARFAGLPATSSCWLLR